MRAELALALVASITAGGLVAFADAPADPPGIALQRLPRPETHMRVMVSSPAFAFGAPIPAAYMEASPPLSWSAQAGAKAYALIVEDPDAPRSTPFVHWMIWNLATTSLPKGLPSAAHPPQAPGAVQGKNDAGGFGYYGPHPPPGRAHHYHFQVFALDAPIDVEPQSDLDEVTTAMKPHVVASGELVGTYQAR